MTAVRVDMKAEARWFYFLHLLWGLRLHVRILCLIAIKIWSFEAIESVQASSCGNQIHVLACWSPVLCTDTLVSHNQQRRLCY